MKYDNLPDTTLAWLAALIDGEGSIVFTRRVDPNRKLKGTYYRSVVSVANTDLRLLKEIVRKTGINRIYEHTRPETVKNARHHRTQYTWRMTSTEIKSVLPQIIPWLVIKKKQARLLLEAIKIAEANTCKAGVKRKRVNPERKHQIYSLIRNLNQKGRTWKTVS